MAINVEVGPLLPTNYIPRDSTNDKGNPCPGITCADAGDIFVPRRLFFTNPDATSDITVDASGYLPHVAMRPRYEQVTDPRANFAKIRRGIPTNDPTGHAFGNDANKPCIRLDLAPVRCRFACQLSVEGGAGPGGGPTGPGAVAAGWIWDRAEAERPVRAQTDDVNGFIDATYTVFNVGGVTPDGIPMSFLIPEWAWAVQTPDAQTLTASFGGVTSAVYNLRFGSIVPVGPWIQMTSPAVVPVLIWHIRY